jgi:WD40 repeat protein
MASGSHAQSTLPNVPLPETSTRPTPKHRFEGHQRAIESFVFLHDNVHIVSGSLDGTMCKWDCDTGCHVGEPWKGEGGGIFALALSPDGRCYARKSRNPDIQGTCQHQDMALSFTIHSLVFPHLLPSSTVPYLLV